MTTTIDAAGRLVIPKAIRDAAGIQPGMPLEARYRDGRIEIEPSPANVRLEDRDGMLVAVYEEDTPPLRDSDVNATIDRLRTERG